ncbi:MAG: hypothetical protein J3Q66DRAFT_398914 [Benniella sp.]|nr:MAG: hypothetical protein J3Q66DRAFT_398914 [Benniella sp.]
MASLAKITEPPQRSVKAKLSKNKRAEKSSIVSSPVAETHLTRLMVDDRIKVKLSGSLAVVDNGWNAASLQDFAGERLLPGSDEGVMIWFRFARTMCLGMKEHTAQLAQFFY